jgi:hypothetical protein
MYTTLDDLGTDAGLTAIAVSGNMNSCREGRRHVGSLSPA